MEIKNTMQYILCLSTASLNSRFIAAIFHDDDDDETRIIITLGFTTFDNGNEMTVYGKTLTNLIDSINNVLNSGRNSVPG